MWARRREEADHVNHYVKEAYIQLCLKELKQYESI